MQINIIFSIPVIEWELKALVTGAGARHRRRGGNVSHVPREAYVYAPRSLLKQSITDARDGENSRFPQSLKDETLTSFLCPHWDNFV